MGVNEYLALKTQDIVRMPIVLSKELSFGNGMVSGRLGSVLLRIDADAHLIHCF